MKTFFLPLILFFIGCEKLDTLECEKGIVLNSEGLDFCNDYSIKLNDSIYYYPLNLNSNFKVDSLSICFTYEILDDSFKNCGFAGYYQVVNILKIE